MKNVSAFLILTFLFSSSAVDESNLENTISCSDFSSSVVGFLLYRARSTVKSNKYLISISLATNENRDPQIINFLNVAGFLTSTFNPSRKTCIIIHGYNSGSDRKWVRDLAGNLLNQTEANVLLVDWSKGSNKLNYVNAVRNMQDASRQIYNFLQFLRNQMPFFGGSLPSETVWSHLHFLGHSLGAHLSAQVAHLLKSDPFWHIDRITGFDPAKPCFNSTDIELSQKLDAGDADFVDVIHTQSGIGGSYDLGLKERVGHIDYWVNGGLDQPECLESKHSTDLKVRACSHGFSYKYFTDSLNDSSRSTCAYLGIPWDETPQDAKQIVRLKTRFFDSCAECPKIGLNLPNRAAQGNYLVLVGSKAPYCHLEEKDYLHITESLEKLKNK